MKAARKELIREVKRAPDPGLCFRRPAIPAWLAEFCKTRMYHPSFIYSPLSRSEKIMKVAKIKSMSFDQLVALRDNVVRLISDKAASTRRELEAKLAAIEGLGAYVGAKRGPKPRGRKLEDFAIGKPGRKPGRKTKR